jgi:hypothetical protein
VTPRGEEPSEARKARRGHHQPGGLAARRSVSPPGNGERKKELDVTQTTSATISDDDSSSETDEEVESDAASSKQCDGERRGSLVDEAIGLRIMQARTADEILQVAVDDGYRFQLSHCARCLGRLADCKKEDLDSFRED